MGELLLPALAWALFLSWRPRKDSGRRYVRWVLAGLAVSLTALTPAVYALVEHHTGIPHLPRLVAHGSMLFAVWAGLKFFMHVNGLGAGRGWHTCWVAGAFVVMCLLYIAAPDFRPQSPGVLEYCVVYLVAQAPAFAIAIRLGLRFAVLADRPGLRLGLRLVVAGSVGALAYLVNKVALAAAARFDFDYPLGHTVVVSKVLPAAAHLLVLLGALLPALLGWLHRYHLYQRLGPLWRALYRAEPAIALEPPAAPDLFRVNQLRLHLYRRVIEIRDGLLILRSYRDPDIVTTATAQATREGMQGQQLKATVEAVTLAAALRSRAAGTPPTTPKATITGGDDIDSDTAFLSQVARVYRKTT